jgi:hypothetical protein
MEEEYSGWGDKDCQAIVQRNGGDFGACGGTKKLVSLNLASSAITVDTDDR